MALEKDERVKMYGFKNSSGKETAGSKFCSWSEFHALSLRLGVLQMEV